MLVSHPVQVDEGSPFPLSNIPFGVFSTKSQPIPRIGTIIGRHVLDLNLLASKGILAGEEPDQNSSSSTSVLLERDLNAFAAQGREFCSSIRSKIIDLLSEPKSILFTDDDLNQRSFVSSEEAIMHLPMHIGGFTDFLCSDTHASNCAQLAGQSLHPSFYGFPTAYNGRASSVVVSGTPLPRPHGMVRLPTTSNSPPSYTFQPTSQLDFELEVGVFISTPVPFGSTTTADEATTSHIFGFVLLNDWSARDVQFAEMIPLGPFQGKASMTSITPWIIMPDALKFAECGTSRQKAMEDAHLLPDHMRHADLGKSTLDVDLEVAVVRKDKSSTTTTTVCRSNLRHLYWSPGQMVAHHASSGCGLRTGDLMGTGTISGPNHRDEMPTLGCLFELTQAGRKGIPLAGGEGKEGGKGELRWLEDGDEVVFTGYAVGNGGKDSVGFGELRGLIKPAREMNGVIH